MKIAVIRRSCSLKLGGAERYCANVSLGLNSLGHKVTVIADYSGLENVDFERAKVIGRGSILKNLSFFYSVKKLLKEQGFDIVYGLSRVEGVDCLRISDPLHKVWLELGYGESPFHRIIRMFSPRHLSILYQEKRAINTSRFIITNSNMVKEQVSRYYDISERHIFTIYNGVDLNRFRPISEKEKREFKEEFCIDEDKALLVFAGSDYRRKGLFILFDALKKLLKEKYPFHLVVLGVSTKEGKPFKRCLESGLEEHVSFMGYRHDSERFFSAADLLCLPTLYDPFANVCLESMACGTPVITTNSNGASELVKMVSKDLVIKEPTPQAVLTALNHFFSLKEDDKEELQNKSLLIAKKYSWKDHIKKLEELFTIFLD